MKKALGGLVIIALLAVGAFVLFRGGGETEIPPGQVVANGILTLSTHDDKPMDPTGLTLSLLEDYGGISVAQATVIDGGYFRFDPVRPGPYSLIATDGSIPMQQITIKRGMKPLLLDVCGDCSGMDHAGMKDMPADEKPAKPAAADKPAKPAKPAAEKPDKPAAEKPAAEKPAKPADEKPAAAATAVMISSAADGNLKYDMAEYTAPAGKITLRYTNPSPVPHNVAIDVDGAAKEGKVIQGGASDDLVVDLKPGTYEIYCSVPGHRQAGMVAKLVVT